MSTNAPHAPGEFGEPPAPAGPARGPVRGPAYYARRALKALASLRLTVALFALAMLLIFFGTMAQIDNGIWTVVDKYFYSLVVWVPFELIHKFLGVFWKEQFPGGEPAWTGTFPLPAGQLIGGLMLANLLAAHATRFRLAWKRLGIFLIHGGLILLFVGEFITREYAVEQQMRIKEGESVNYAEDTRNYELAFIGKSDPNADRVTVVPQDALKKPGARVAHPDLPADVEVVEYMTNSLLTPARAGQANPADRGVGAGAVAVKQAEASGIDPSQKNDMPAVYVRLYKKGTNESLGTYLASFEGAFRFGPDEVEVDGKKYEMSLRRKRYYKPFRIHLDKFRFDRYTGTEKAKNYSSDVRVLDETGKELFPKHIAMNEPLRYNGETFYQADFDHETEKATVLQVVKNPGWLLPYIACVVVGLGLAAHFGIYLIQFLKRGAAARAAAAVPAAGEPLSPVVRYFPWVVLGVAAVYLLSVFGRMAPPKEPVDLDAAGRVPVVEGGRVKPLDTVARVHLRTISGREEFEDEAGKKQPAIRWYLEVLAGGSPQQRGPVWKYPVFRIDNEALLRDLKLANVAGFRYSLEEIAPKIGILQQRMAEIQKNAAAGKKLETDELKFKELRDRLQTFMELSALGGPLLLPPQNGKDWTTIHEFRLEAQIAGTKAAIAEAQRLLGAAKKLDNVTPEDEQNLILQAHGVDLSKVKVDPERRAGAVADAVDQIRADPGQTEATLEKRLKEREAGRAVILATVNEALKEQRDLAAVLLPEADRKAVDELAEREQAAVLATRPANATWERIVTAYRAKNAGDFSAAVAEYAATDTAAVSAKDRARARVELIFNRYAPFYQCTGLYVLAFVLSVVGFAQHAAQRPHWGAALRKAATFVLLLALGVHTVALFGRMYIMDRPLVFVTNLYSSAIFIGWGCVALCVALERIFPLGVGNVLAAMLGLATCIVAHNLATEDTLEMMQAVLDTNFWLATHVTTVTLGYTATFVAGFLGALYVFQMLGAVVRDSYESTGEPTVGALLAFGAAATGVVGVPLFFLWFMTSAMDKYELLPSAVLWPLYWLTVAAGVVYAVALMLLRVSYEGADAQGKPRAGRVPGLARPVAALGLTPERGKVFGQMVYGVVCFATLLSFVGTVLGGIWADQSWGRFWGWDPKENGAVLIVLWNSLILHARWSGLVKDRGVAVLAIFGNAMTAWSWFGTNQLRLGLHSYGFDTRLADGCFNFWVSQLFVLGWGLIPRRFWASAAKRPAAPAAPAASPVAGAAPLPTTPPSPNGSANGPATPPANGNGQPNGHPRRDKGKKHRRK
jgi:ABC-type transport system involved in cytochrome c biogenesis permease subunit